ncbi:MAG: NAD-dependent epimerase/dehydratase family protein [Bdellovibrionales bacterium]|nr:NAD-dependent epimerase/dehydratase family protein [Bdellovibrionales bacterium]
MKLFRQMPLVPLNLLESCRSISSLKSLVLVSTYSVLTHLNTYTASKHCAEIMGLSYFHSHGLPVCICRLANIYGPGQSQDAVVPSIIRQMLQSSDLKIGNLSAKRDFLYIEDAAEALVAVMLNLEAKGQTVHLGTGTATSIGQIVEVLTQITGFQGAVQVEDSRLRSNDPNVDPPDTSFLLNHVCWKPKVDLFTGLDKTVAFLKAK